MNVFSVFSEERVQGECCYYRSQSGIRCHRVTSNPNPNPGVSVLSRCLKDTHIVLLGLLSVSGGLLMAAFAKTTLLMFLGEKTLSRNLVWVLYIVNCVCVRACVRACAHVCVYPYVCIVLYSACYCVVYVHFA